MRQVRVVETISETSMGPRSAFVVEEKRWWGWSDISTVNGYRLGDMEQVADFLRMRSTPERVVIHAPPCAASGLDRTKGAM
jgi:hypothetical protein